MISASLTKFDSGYQWGGYDVDGSNDDDGNGHHDNTDDGVDDLGDAGGSDFQIDEMN